MISLSKERVILRPESFKYLNVFAFTHLILSLHCFVPDCHSAEWIKWESGESPEQSRCCDPMMCQALL